MQFIADKINIGQDFNEGAYTVTFYTKKSPIRLYEELQNTKQIDVEAKKYRKKRSLDANAYCWVLCNNIANELSKEGITTKEEIYRDAILQVGTFEPFIVQEKTFENFKRIWEKQGLGFLVQEVNRKDKCVKVNCYYGSSTYNTKEMSLLIEILIQLAKSLNIETKSKSEIDSLLKEWDKK